MKRILAFLVTIMIFQAVRLEKSERLKEENAQYLPGLGGCTSNQTKAVNDALQNCEEESVEATLSCINASIIANTTLGQKWNIVASLQNQTQLGIQFWHFSNCYVNFTEYGSYNRTYILWPDNVFTTLAQNLVSNEKNIFKEAKLSQLQQKNFSDQNLQVGCSNWRQKLANATLQYCDGKNNKIAAQCIVNRLRYLAAEYWNVVVSSQDTIMVNGYYFSCFLQFPKYGTYKRDIIIWKAYNG